MLTRWQHTDDDVRALSSLGGRCCDRRALSSERRTGSFDKVKNSQIMTRSQQVLGHRATHVAQSQKRNSGHVLLR